MKKLLLLTCALALVAGCATTQHSAFTAQKERELKNTYNPYKGGVGGMRPAR